MPELTWKHHTLIQALLSRGPLKHDEFHKIFEDVTGRSAGSYEQLFNDYLLKINKELSYVQFELRGCRNQYDGKVYYGVINKVADDQSKLGTKYSVPQIAFYKGIIEAIVQDSAGQGSISNIDALNIKLENQVPTATQTQLESQSQPGASVGMPAAFRNFSLSQKEQTLHELVQDRWLYSTSGGKIGLGVRSFLDLRSWFHQNDVPACHFCNEAAIKAEFCPTEGCPVRIHKYCLIKKFSQRKVEKVCPGCGNPWPYSVSEAEALEYQDELKGSTQIQPSTAPSKRKRGKSCITHDSETVESGPALSSVTSDATNNLRRSTRSSVRLR
ncbi:hypothetical protein Ancab_011402 [Ancistrocladus abbreviatus]